MGATGYSDLLLPINILIRIAVSFLRVHDCFRDMDIC